MHKSLSDRHTICTYMEITSMKPIKMADVKSI